MFITRIAGVCALVVFGCSFTIANELRVISPISFREGAHLPVRLERLDASGSVAKEVWSTNGLVVLQNSDGLASTNEVEFLNGIALLHLETFGTNDLQIIALDFSASSDRTIAFSPGPDTSAGGLLTGEVTTWTGVVHVTNDVTIPAGHTLRLEPGTLILLDGVLSGTTAPDLLVQGTVESLGTAAQPVWFTSADASANWGQIRHSSGSRGLYRHTFIHKGGRAPGEGHTSAGPVLRLSGADVRLENCVISDLWSDRAIGKGMYARNSELVFADTIFARMRMGPEIEGTSLLCTNSYFLEMRGPDDCDGLYLHNSGGKNLAVVDSVFIGGDDDGIDTLSANVGITNCIFRGWLNENEDAKAISVFNGEVQIDRCLVADCFSGVLAKASSSSSALVRIDRSTIVTKTHGAGAAWKSNATGPNVIFDIRNSIVRGQPALFSDFAETNLTVQFSNSSTPWDGLELSTADPLFVNSVAHDYRLSAGSPAIDAGDPMAPLDPDGTRADLGYFPFHHGSYAASATLRDGRVSISLEGAAPGRTIIVQTSTDLVTWQEFSRTVAATDEFSLAQALDGNLGAQFYRFLVE